MFCKKCGKEVDESFVYCPYCGTKCDNEPLTKSRDEMFLDIPVDKPVNTSKASVGWFFLGLICPIAGLVLYIVKANEFPSMAKRNGVGALVGSIIYFILFVFLFTISMISIANGGPIF